MYLYQEQNHGTSGGWVREYKKINGENFVDAVERNFKALAEAAGFAGASGFTLKNVSAEHMGNGIANVTMVGWPFSKALVGFKPDMLSDDALVTKSIKIEGVNEEEIPGGYCEFEIKI